MISRPDALPRVAGSTPTSLEPHPFTALRAQTPHTGSLWKNTLETPVSASIGALHTGTRGGVPCAQSAYVEIPAAWSEPKKCCVHVFRRAEGAETC